ARTVRPLVTRPEQAGQRRVRRSRQHPPLMEKGLRLVERKECAIGLEAAGPGPPALEPGERAASAFDGHISPRTVTTTEGVISADSTERRAPPTRTDRDAAGAVNIR